MAGRRGTARCYPRHLGQPTGKGLKECEASGFIRRKNDIMDDVRQGQVSKEFADKTAGFGTRHPQDVVQLGVLDDPKPVEKSVPPDNKNLSKADLSISDQEIKASIIEGRAPRIGF